MNQFMQWLNMGGYSMYVWPAYGLVGFVLVINMINIQRQKKRTKKMLDQWFKSNP